MKTLSAAAVGTVIGAVVCWAIDGDVHYAVQAIANVCGTLVIVWFTGEES